jgi:hypothetical protein
VTTHDCGPGVFPRPAPRPTIPIAHLRGGFGTDPILFVVLAGVQGHGNADPNGVARVRIEPFAGIADLQVFRREEPERWALFN